MTLNHTALWRSNFHLRSALMHLHNGVRTLRTQGLLRELIHTLPPVSRPTLRYWRFFVTVFLVVALTVSLAQNASSLYQVVRTKITIRSEHTELAFFFFGCLIFGTTLPFHVSADDGGVGWRKFASWVARRYDTFCRANRRGPAVGNVCTTAGRRLLDRIGSDELGKLYV